MTPLTDEQPEAIKTRADKATPGPWYRVGPPWNNDVPFVVAGDEDPHKGRFICDLEMIFADDESEADRDQVADAEFIAHARQDVPALLAEVERLNTAIDGGIQHVGEVLAGLEQANSLLTEAEKLVDALDLGVPSDGIEELRRRILVHLTVAAR